MMRMRRTNSAALGTEKSRYSRKSTSHAGRPRSLVPLGKFFSFESTFLSELAARVEAVKSLPVKTDSELRLSTAIQISKKSWSNYVALFPDCFFFTRPALKTISDVIKLFDAGMTMARLNLSHGNMKTNMKLLSLYAEAKRLRPHKTCALMIDIRGREIRVSHYKEETQFLEFAIDDVITLKTGAEEIGVASDAECLRVDCGNLPKVLRPTDVLYFDDGRLNAEVIDVDEDSVKIRFKCPGRVAPCSQIKLQGSKYEMIPILNVGDIIDLKAIYEKFPFEYVSLPVVQESKDLHEFRLSIGSNIASKIQVLAKVDNVKSLHQFENILPHADGIVIVRQDLGLELPPEKLILAQKWVIQRSIALAKPVFV